MRTVRVTIESDLAGQANTPYREVVTLTHTCPSEQIQDIALALAITAVKAFE